MKRYYECHITIDTSYGYLRAAGQVKSVVESEGWIFSEINGDPDLGPGTKCYATKHFNARRTCAGVVRELNEVAKNLELKGCKVLRQKVEFVMYDQRVSK